MTHAVVYTGTAPTEVACAAALSRLPESLLFRVAPHDALTFTAVAALLPLSRSRPLPSPRCALRASIPCLPGAANSLLQPAKSSR